MILQDEEKAKTLLKLAEQHWLHCRHIETERSWFMIYYAIVITGGSISSITIKNFNLSWLLYFIIVFTFFGFFQNIRWSYAFECHRMRVNLFLIRIDQIYHLPINNKDLLTMKIPSMKGLWRAKGILRTRYLFPLFYFIVLILFAISFQGAARYGAVLTLIIAFILGIRARLSFKELDATEKLL